MRIEQVADVSDGAPEGVEGARLGLSEVCFELGEDFLDRVEVGGVGRQEQEPGAPLLEAGGGPWAFVDGEIVEDDDVALVQGRGELGLDVEIERGPVHGLVDDPGRGQAMAAQAGDEGLRAPVAEGRRGGQSGSLAAATAQAGHLGGEAGLVEENEAVAGHPHQRLTLRLPDPTVLTHVGAFLLGRHQGFFYM